MASKTPTVAWQITVDASADAYLATLRAPEAHEALVTVRLPRRTIDDTVFAVSVTTLELTSDGTVAAYAESGVRTLVRTPLSALIAEATSPDALNAEEEPAGLDRLEAELVRGLDLVRQARR